MWIMLNDAFFSIVKKDCAPDELLVRARRAGDIEKVFGKRKVDRDTRGDYLYRARIGTDHVCRVMASEVQRVNYANFKDSVRSPDLHSAYHGVWHEMARVQRPKPYSFEGHEDERLLRVKPLEFNIDVGQTVTDAGLVPMVVKAKVRRQKKGGKR